MRAFLVLPLIAAACASSPPLKSGSSSDSARPLADSGVPESEPMEVFRFGIIADPHVTGEGDEVGSERTETIDHVQPAIERHQVAVVEIAEVPDAEPVPRRRPARHRDVEGTNRQRLGEMASKQTPPGETIEAEGEDRVPDPGPMEPAVATPGWLVGVHHVYRTPAKRPWSPPLKEVSSRARSKSFNR